MSTFNNEDTPNVGYVIEIPDECSVIINLGEKDGFSLGDKVDIFEEGPDVIDPFTETNLGRRVFIKKTVEITEISELYSICQHKTNAMAPLSITMGSLLSNSTTPLHLKEDEIKHWAIKEPKIKIGDPVKKH